ncbi:MAG: DUF1826 domain-containing protein [Salibacteraceae bacterium]
MNTLQTSYANAVLGADFATLENIHQPSKNIAIYQREIHHLQADLAVTNTQHLAFQSAGAVVDVLQELNAYFSEHLPTCHRLLEDITNTFLQFEKITRSDSLKLMLTTVDTNMCRIFHTDINDLRLLCTYVGPGTLWVPNEAVHELPHATGGRARELAIDEAHIQQVVTGDIVVLKGALYPQSNPILHRSPAIEACGEQRLMLRMDVNESLT